MVEITGRDIIPKRTHFGKRSAPEEVGEDVRLRIALIVMKKLRAYPQVIVAFISVSLFLLLYISFLPKNNAALILPSFNVTLENQYDSELIALIETYIKNYYSLTDTRKKIAHVKSLRVIEDAKTVAAEEPKKDKNRFRKKDKPAENEEKKKFVSKEEMSFLTEQKKSEQNLYLITTRYRAYLERKMQHSSSEIQSSDLQQITKNDQRIAELILHLDSIGHLQYRTVLEDIVNRHHLEVIPRNLENLMPHRVLQMTANTSLRAMTTAAVIKLTDKKTLSIDMPLQKQTMMTEMYKRQELRLNILMAKDMLEQGDFSDNAKMNLGFAVGAYLQAMQQDPAYQGNNLFLKPEFNQRWRTVTDHKILSWLSDLTYTNAIELYPQEEGIALLVK